MRVICLGDSLTAGYGVSSDDCWVTRAQLRTGFSLENRGVSGMRTRPMHLRLQRLLQNPPDVLMLMGGVNDLIFEGLDRGEAALENIRAMLDSASAAAVLPILGLPPDICPHMLTPEWRAAFDPNELIPTYHTLRNAQRALAEARRIRTIDFNAVLHEASAFFDLSDLLFDGLHPNPKGHRAMAYAASAALLSLKINPKE